MSRTLAEMTKREEKRNNRGDDENKGNVGINENDDLRHCRQYWLSAAQTYGSCLRHVNDKQYFLQAGGVTEGQELLGVE